MLVALFHLAHRPAQGIGGFLRIDDHRREQVRDVLVHAELEALRVDHDHPHVVGRGAIEDAREHRVQAYRLAGAGGAGDEQVRHGREIGHERLAVDGLAERDRELRGRARVGLRLEQLTQRDRLAVRIRDLDADRALPRDAIDEHRLGLHRQAQVVGEARHLAVLHAGVRLELERRHDRAGMDLHHRAFDRELAALLLEMPGGVHQLALVDLPFALRGIEQRGRRQHVGAVAPRRRRHRLRLGERQRGRRRHAHRRLRRRTAGDDGRRGGHGGRHGLGRRTRVGRGDTGARRRRLLGRLLQGRRGLRRLFLRGVLGEHLAPLLGAAALVEVPGDALAQGQAAGAGDVDPLLEQTAERHLRRQHDGECEQGDQHDRGPGAIQVGRERTRDHLADEAPRLVGAGAGGRGADHQAEHRARAAEQDEQAGGLRVGGVDGPAPEVVPAGGSHQHRQHVGREAEHLERQLGQERPHRPDEVRRHFVGAGREEPRRVVRVVADERDEPDQARREQRHPDDLAHAPRDRRVEPGRQRHRRRSLFHRHSR